MKKSLPIETKEKVIKRLLAGEALKGVLADYPEATKSSATWARLKKRYLKAGISALEDKRKLKASKLSPELKSAIIMLKQESPGLSYTQIAARIKARFAVRISRSMISIILRQAGFKGTYGRKKSYTPKETSQGKIFPWVGMSFIIATEQQMGFSEAWNNFLLQLSPAGSLKIEHIKRIKQLIQKYPYITNILTYLATMGYQRISDVPRELKDGIIVFWERKRGVPDDILLEYLQLIKLVVPEALKAKAVKESLNSALGGELKLADHQKLFIDAQATTLWAQNDIPGYFASPFKRTLDVITQTIIESSVATPLVLYTTSGYTYLPPETINLFSCFNQPAALKAISIVSPAGEILAEFKPIKAQKRYFVCGLGPWQYKNIKVEGYNKPLHTLQIPFWPEKLKVSDARISVSQAGQSQRLAFRAALIEQENYRFALITNLEVKEQPDIGALVKLYLSRWPDVRESYFDLLEKAAQSQDKGKSLDATSMFPSSYTNELTLFSEIAQVIIGYVYRAYFIPQFTFSEFQKFSQNIFSTPGYLKVKQRYLRVGFSETGSIGFKKSLQKASQAFNQKDSYSPKKRKIFLSLTA